MAKTINKNIRMEITMEVTEGNFAPHLTIQHLISIVKSMPLEFDMIQVKTYYGYLNVYRDSNLQNLVELSNMHHDNYHRKLKESK